MSAAITTRPMDPDDLDAVLAIDRAVGWSHAEDRLRYLLDDPETRGLVAESAGEVVGFAFAGARERVGWLGAVAVAPAWQGRGIATTLCTAADAWLREAGCDAAVLEALATNAPALAVYRRLGFVVTGIAELCGTPHGEAPVVPVTVELADDPERLVAPLTPDDLPLLYALDDAYYGGWREQDLLSFLDAGPDLARLLRVGGEPLGYCLAERATGRLGPAAAPALPDLLALLDAILPLLPHGAGAPSHAAHLRIIDPDATALAALAARNLHPVPALRNLRLEQVYRRPLRRLAGYYLSARHEKG